MQDTEGEVNWIQEGKEDKAPEGKRRNGGTAKEMREITL